MIGTADTPEPTDRELAQQLRQWEGADEMLPLPKGLLSLAAQRLERGSEALRAEIAEGEKWSDRCMEQQARAEASEASRAALELEVNNWRSCALYDAMMEGPKFKGWNRSSLDRCRKEYIDAALAPPAQDASEKETGL